MEVHNELLKRLRTIRDTICLESNLPVYLVATVKTLEDMARYLPLNSNDLRKIPGFGPAKTYKYGERFLTAIYNYCNEKNITSLIHEIPDKVQRPTSINGRKVIDSRYESVRMFKNGLSTAEIARKRSVTVQTIENHLLDYVKSGDIFVNELISDDKIRLINEALVGWDGLSLIPVKDKLIDSISFGDIRYCIAANERKKIADVV